MLDRLLRDIWRFTRHAFGMMLRGWLIAVILGAVIAEAAGYFIEGGWPQRVFVHVAAAAFALTLGYATGVTLALIELIRGLAVASTRIDDVVKAAATGGINVIDHVVDAVDGPNRHGFLNKE